MGEIDDDFVAELLCASLGCDDVKYVLDVSRQADFSLDVLKNYGVTYSIFHADTGVQIANEQVAVVVDGDAVVAIHGPVFAERELDGVVSEKGWQWHRRFGQVRIEQNDVDRRMLNRAGETIAASPVMENAYESTSCIIPRHSFETTSMLSLTTAKTNETLPCGRINDGTSICNWQLSREASGTVHQLGRVTEEGTSQAVQSSFCSNSSTNITGRELQQDAYAWTYKLRTYLFDRYWNVVSRDTHSNVQINIQNDPGCPW